MLKTLFLKPANLCQNQGPPSDARGPQGQRGASANCREAMGQGSQGLPRTTAQLSSL